MYKQVYIGIDQSYQNTGISIIADGVLRDIKSVPLDKLKTNSKRRRVLRKRLNSLIAVVVKKSENVTVICEQTRVHGGGSSFINVDAIKAMGVLTSIVVDACEPYGVEVYSVDTRCWKSQVIGTSKPMDNKFGVPPEKWPTIQWVIAQGFEDKILVEVVNARKKKGVFERNGLRYTYNNDAADSAGIAMFGIVGDATKLQLER